VSHSTDDTRGARRYAILALVACSGFAALVYEVLWLKELRLLFGNTAHAAAATLSVFFGGLALGGYVFARAAPKVKRPLRAYALLELGIALAALIYFGVIAIYRAAYAPLFGALGESRFFFASVKVILAAVLMLPGTTLMGGTLPVVAQVVVRTRGALARSGALLYGLNTAGGVLGVLVAGFVLPPAIGYRATYAVAITVSAAVAIAAFALSRARDADGGGGRLDGATGDASAAAAGSRARTATIIAALSGFVALAMEVLWTRMLAQVFQNSVYSFSIILVVFLSAIAVASFIARRLSRLEIDAGRVLRAVMIVAGAAVALTPLMFYAATDGMTPIVFTSGLVRTTWIAALVIFPAGVLMCLVFPYLLRLVEGTWAPGTAIGLLSSANTLGGVAGSLFAGFVLLEIAGPYAAAWVLAAAYPIAVAAGDAFGEDADKRRAILPASVALALLIVAFAVGLPDVRIDAESGDAVEGVWHGSGSTVTVVSRRDADGSTTDLVMKMNNWYGLGSVSGAPNERRLAHVPLLLHPRPRSVFFLGMATGITAGAALSHPVDRVVVCELSPEVVEAARSYFAPHAGGLFSDPRVTIAVEDGRAYLAGTAETFDVVIGDLFLPWAAGTGSLFTREHFVAVRERLAPGGIFAQWLPLYQMTEREFATIARTAMDVFGSVTLWRGNFSPANPMLAIVCGDEGATLDTDAMVRNARGLLARGLSRGDMVDFLYGGVTAPDPTARAFMSRAADRLVDALPFTFYAGNLSAAALLEPGEINTDDRPLVEYRAAPAPASERMGFVAEDLAEFQHRLAARVPPERDPYLAGSSPARASYVRAGLEYFEANVFREAGRDADARAKLAAYMRRIGAALPGARRDVAPQRREEPEGDRARPDEAGTVAVAVVADAPPNRGAGRSDLPGTRTIVVRVKDGAEALLDAQALRSLSAGGRDPYRVALDGLWKTFRCEASEYRTPDGTRVVLLAGEHPYVSAHALLLDRYEAYLGARGALVAVPNRDALIVSPVGAGDVTAAARTLAATVARMSAGGAMPVSEKLYWYAGGRFEVVPCEMDGDEVRVTLPVGLR